MVWRRLNQQLTARRGGAPFWALSLIILVWVVGRILWVSYTPEWPQHVAAHWAMIDYGDRAIAALPKLRKDPKTDEVTAAAAAVSAIRYDLTRHGQIVSSYAVRTAAADILKADSVDAAESAEGELFHNHSTEISAAPAGDVVGIAIRDVSNATAIYPHDVAIEQQETRFSNYSWLNLRSSNGQRDAFDQLPLSMAAKGRDWTGQSGTIFAYRISDDPQKQIAVYGRLSSALDISGESQVAIGVQYRPSAQLPVDFHIEREYSLNSSENGQTAFFVTSGLSKQLSTGEMIIDGFLQAGGKIGVRDSHFYDASLLLRHQTTLKRNSQLLVGAGAWAKGNGVSSRVAIGPHISLSMSAGTAAANISLAWQHQITGDGVSENGAMITISSGF